MRWGSETWHSGSATKYSCAPPTHPLGPLISKTHRISQQEQSDIAFKRHPRKAFISMAPGNTKIEEKMLKEKLKQVSLVPQILAHDDY